MSEPKTKLKPLDLTFKDKDASQSKAEKRLNEKQLRIMETRMKKQMEALYDSESSDDDADKEVQSILKVKL
jgi:hypothetical protein